MASVGYAILLIHHLLQQCLVIGVHWRNGDVTNRSELTAVVQVLILQSKEVPDEPPEITQKINLKQYCNLMRAIVPNCLCLFSDTANG